MYMYLWFTASYCSLDCLPLRQGNRCTNSTHIESRISMQCCPGTSPRKSDLVLDQEREALSISYLPLDVSPPGCAVGECVYLFLLTNKNVFFQQEDLLFLIA